MNAKAPIRLDLNNFFSPSLTDGPGEISECSARFDEIHRGVKALRSTGQLAFAHVPDDIRAISETLALAEQFKGVKNVLVFGIGGSALGAKSVHQALGAPLGGVFANGARLHIVDNVDALTHLELAGTLRDEDNAFVFVSKSGNTAETLAQYLFAKKAFPKLSKDNVVFITDPGEGCLRDLAGKQGCAALSIPPGVGGRFSVFTPAGLFPLALAGHDIEALLEGARQGERLCREGVLTQNPAALLAFTSDHWFRKGMRQLVFMPYADRLALFADWAAQLFAESLNKKTTISGGSPAYGVTPIKALGTTDQHSQLQLYLDGVRDKLVLFLEVESVPEARLAGEADGDDRLDFLSGKTLNELIAAEKRATEECLRENGRPNATAVLAAVNAFQIGQLYQVFMNVVPYLGALLDINAYDQPAVERIKKFTFGLMGKNGYGDFTQKMAENPKRREFLF